MTIPPNPHPEQVEALKPAIAKIVRQAMQEEFLRGTEWEHDKGRVQTRVTDADARADAILVLLASLANRPADDGERP